jgi:hypothetical protein
MYSPQIKSIDQVDAGTAYTNRLFASMNELVSAKEKAITTENYQLAEQLRHKITSIQLQIIKTEHQFSADLISNFVTVWQHDTADTLSALMEPMGGKLANAFILPNQFPLKEQSQISFIELVYGCPPKYYDSLIKVSTCCINYRLFF